MKHYLPSQLNEITKAYQDQKLLIVPTDTVFGLSALFGNPETLQRLKEAKGRLEEKPIPVAVSSIEMASRIADLSPQALALMEQFLPGALTLIVKRKEDIDPVFSNGKDTLAIRIPDSRVLLQLVTELDQPVFLTSANLSGQPEAKSIEQADALQIQADGLVEGSCDFRQASTIVDVSGKEPILIRQGPISFETILKAFKTAV